MAGKSENYQDMTKEELIKLMHDLKKDLRQMRFDRVLGSNFNLVDFKGAKKKLAQVLTFIREKELQESQGSKK